MNNELIALLDDRAATYGLLARLLGLEIDSELLAALRTGALPGDTGSADIDAGLGLINAYLQNGAGPDAMRTELAVDFARLFIVRSPEATDAPYPFESAYTSGEGLTVSDVRSTVHRTYLEASVDKNAAWNVAEDHIALELEFMQVLAARTAESLRQGDVSSATGLLSRQAAFMDAHLLTWAPRLAAAMTRAAHTDFYRGVASFLTGWLHTDRKTLTELLAESA